MKILKAVALLMAVMLAAVLPLAGCAGKGPEGASAQKADDKMLIGMSFDSFVIERWQRDRDVFVSTAQALGAEVNVQNANGSLDEQKAQLDYFIQKKVDAIVIVAVDCFALSDVVKKAREAGIYVVAYDRLLMNSGVDLYVSFDNEMVGRMMGQALANNLAPGSRVLNICGSQADNNVAQTSLGFDDIMKRNGMNVVRTVYADGWLAETAYKEVNQAVADGLEFDAVRCGNDDLATQAFLALSEHRLAGDVLLVGQDADLAACQRIVEGTQLMTVYKPVEKLAKQAAERVVQLIKGEPMDVLGQIYDGRAMVPYEKLMPVMVTKRNIDREIIDGGFHRREQVYLNVQ